MQDLQESSFKSRRRCKRLALTLPVQIKFPSNKGDSWEEITRLREISMIGAGLTLDHPVQVGSLLFITLSLPAELRCFDHGQPQYNMWGVVRYLIPTNTQTSEAAAKEKNYHVGIAFIGKQPPQSFLADPSTLYDIQGVSEDGLWKVMETSAALPTAAALEDEETTLHIPYNVLVEALDENGNTNSASMTGMVESTITETVSAKNACIYSSLPLAVGGTVRLSCPEMKTTFVCRVAEVDSSQSGFTRIHLEFIDRSFPLDGLEH